MREEWVRDSTPHATGSRASANYRRLRGLFDAATDLLCFYDSTRWLPAVLGADGCAHELCNDAEWAYRHDVEDATWLLLLRISRPAAVRVRTPGQEKASAVRQARRAQRPMDAAARARLAAAKARRVRR